MFVAVFVLFAQYGAGLHALSHAVQDVAESGHVQQDRHGPSGHESCEQCLSFAAAGPALLGNHTFSLSTFAHDVRTPLYVVRVLRRTTTAYHSRAPPQRFV
ncbi:MAG: hypothetical protein JWN23_170 [Rhodocyclales bacterium]|nr:hypothetical protein [Rhodocyclales bacterium]